MFDKIVTCYHVMQSVPYATARYSDGGEAGVLRSVSEDKALDLAVLFVAHGGLGSVDRKPTSLMPTALKLYDGPPVPIGTRVFTIGSPKGLSTTLSEGLVSGYREIAPGVERIQITARISPGSSGGSVLLADGRVLGMASAIFLDGQNRPLRN